MPKIGPSALQQMLEQHGLKLIKTDNVRSNLGLRPEVIVCNLFNITLADPPNNWRPAPHEIEQSAPPMRGDGA